MSLIIWRDATESFDMTGLSFLGFTTVTNATSTSFLWNDSSDGSFWVMTGSGFTYDISNHPTSGTVTSIDTTNGTGQPGVLISDIALAASQLSAWVLANDTSAFLTAGLAGNDTIVGNAGNDTIVGDTGDDRLYGREGNDTIQGGSGNDTLIGEAGNDMLIGGAGVDVLIGGLGTDMLFGDEDADYLLIDGQDFSIDGGAGFDSVFVQTGAAMTLNMGTASIEWAQGNAGADTFNAASQTNAVYIYGQGGDDTLTGSAFGDYLDGGDGTDTLAGGDGADLMLGNGGSDIMLG